MLRKLFQRWQRDEASLMAAAVSYYLALSLFPILLILTSALGVFFRWTDSGKDARNYIVQVIHDQVAPSLATAVDASLAHIQQFATVSGPAAAAMLLGAALLIFAQFERAFDRMWGLESIERPMISSMLGVVTGRLRAFLMLCGVALLLVIVFITGIVLSAVQRHLQIVQAEWFWWSVELIAELAINALAFSALYRFMPKAPVRWKHAIVGGIVAAVIWEIGRQSVAAVIVDRHYANAYGVIGAFLAVMIWGYYAVALIFFAAEIVQLLGEEERAMLPQPAKRKRKRRKPTDEPSAPRENARGGSTNRMPQARAWWFDAGVAALILYVGSFLAIRQWRSEVPVTRQGINAPELAVVRFSDNPTRQRIARGLYAPLIATLPGPYVYDTVDANPPS